MRIGRVLTLNLMFFLAISSSLVPAAANAPEQEALTYSKDVAPILNANCVACHRPNEMAPMSLRTFEEVRPWAKAIRNKVSEKLMPPWHADPAHGSFSNNRSLSDDELTTIVSWVDQGARKGNPNDLPVAPSFPDEWNEGTPDYVLEFGEEVIPGGGEDEYRYRYVTFDVPEDKWIRAVELRPSNRAVAHHAVIFFINDPSSRAQSLLGAWAPGMDAWAFPEGTGKILKSGARLILNMHYHPTDKEERDSTRIGLYFTDKPANQNVVTQFVQNNDFLIPAGSPDYTATATFTFAEDSHIVGMLPHMHYRGKSMRYVATYPDGRQEILINVPKFDFNWQTFYVPSEPIAAPKGMRVDVEAIWDNSDQNLANPNPLAEVTYGRSSDSEMLIGFVDYVVD